MKPGDKVLVPATRCKNPNYVKISAGHPVVHGIEGVVTFAVSGPTGNGKTVVHPHPGIDPTLLPELVAAVREYGQAYEVRGLKGYSETIDAQKTLLALCARMEADDE